MGIANKNIRFFTADAKLNLKNRTLLKIFLIRLFQAESAAVETVNIVFCSDEYLLRINREFLHHDTYTDIVTFNLAQVDQPVQGELYISADRVAENALRYQVPFRDELHRVVFHGALHLCGYEDQTPTQAAKMRLKENSYLKKYKSFVSRETRST